MSLPSVSGIVSEVMQFYKIYQVLLNYTHTKHQKSISIFNPLC